MGAVSVWARGARPRTLPAAVVPVAVGTAAAFAVSGGEGSSVIWWRAALALVVAVALQVGVNYANDYSDGIRGTDADRLGPARLVGSGTVVPKQVKRAAFGAFLVAAGAGLALALAVSLWLVAVGAACVVGAWYYTGGSRPYGYAGFGEVFVFVFFGMVAVVGTAYTQTEELVEALSGVAVVVAVAVGLLAAALLMANNVRDLARDRAAGKRTLAVRLGDRRARLFYVGLVLGAFVVGVVVGVARPWVWLTLAALPMAIFSIRVVLSAAPVAPLLNQTARLHLAYGALLTLGLVLSA